MDLSELKKIEILAGGDIALAETQAALETARIKYLGRERGKITAVLRSLKDLPLDERRRVGGLANAVKRKIEELAEKRKKEISEDFHGRVLSQKEIINLTSPGTRPERGHPHPLAKLEEEIVEIFTAMNFSVVEGPEVETGHYNFDALNVPPDHPARDAWDTFWLKPTADKQPQTTSLLLRTHTSPVQARYMEKRKPPIRIIVPGRCFRYEATDATHEVNFYQVEGLMVDENISLANFKFIVSEFLRGIFGKEIQFRFRPGYFPFVEPGLEVDVWFGKRWLELMGAGMVHRNVFKAVGYDPEKVRGFAFGFGLDRVAMIKYGIPDVRLLYSGDLRLVRQF